MNATNDPPAPPTGPVRREDDILERIAAIVGKRTIPDGEVHVGDDAAVLGPFVGELLISTDSAVWGVHLDADLFSLEDLGYKAVASAVSDLAAMGARPRAAVVAVMAPPGSDLVELHHGIAAGADATACPIVGGDLSVASQIAVAVTVLGECPGRGAVLRRGARAGDELLVTGPLGRAAAGLRRRRAGASLDDPLVTAHRRPSPRLAEGLAARGAGVHAMIDVSDGLALDLHRLADASGVGFVLDEVPVASGATEDEALGGGEDYELLIATDNATRLRRRFADRGLGEPITIGHVTSDVSVRLLANQPLERRGWQHRW